MESRVTGHAAQTPGAPPGSRHVEVVLFDLSGVLADFRGAEALGELLGGLPAQEVWPRWLESPWMRRFDADGCTPEEFAAGIVEEWRLRVTPGELLEAFRGWMVGPYAGAQRLLDRTRARTRIGCLSNMNPLHWHQIMGWRLTSAFEHRFISCEIGLVKPDREIYEYAAAAMALDPGAVLFLDDNLVNVQAAIAVGFQAGHVRGVAEAERALLERGVLG